MTRAARSNQKAHIAPATRYIGMPLKRKEDPRLIQGLSHYVDDVQLAGMHYAAFLRSPYAHAKIRSVDLSKARTAPGVVLALAGPDVAGEDRENTHLNSTH